MLTAISAHSYLAGVRSRFLICAGLFAAGPIHGGCIWGVFTDPFLGI